MPTRSVPTVEPGAGPNIGPSVARVLQHRTIFCISFALYVFAGVGNRMRPNFWRRASRRSIFAEAWAASGTIAELAFAG